MPLMKLKRESHQVLRIARTMRTKPIIDPVAPIDERREELGRSPALVVRRSRACAASDTSHESRSPNSAALRMETNACSGAHRSSTRAKTIENEEVMTARVGDPARLSRPSAAGAQPLRASEKSVRDAA